MFPEKLVVGVFSLTVSLFPYNVRSISLKCEDRWNLFAFCFQEKNTLKHFKLHLRVFLLLKVSNIFHYWPLFEFDHI